MTIRSELEALRRDDGLLVVDDVEIWARDNPHSDLHAAIDWDDESAAREYRFIQIRRLITLHIVDERGTPQMVSLTVDRVKPGGGYRNIADVANDATLREVMLRDAMRALRHWQAKYRHIKACAELRPVDRAIDKAAAKVEHALQTPPSA